MKALRTLIVGMLISAGAMAAAEEPSLTTLTITAKRPNAGVTAVERVPPRATVEIAAPLPTDMPEAAIDHHMAPIGIASIGVVAANASLSE